MSILGARNYIGRLLFAGLLSLAATYVTLRYLPAPFAWLSSFAVIGCLALSAIVSSSTRKAMWLNAAGVFLLLGAFEAYFYINQMPSRRDSLQTPGGDPLFMWQPP